MFYFIGTEVLPQTEDNVYPILQASFQWYVKFPHFLMLSYLRSPTRLDYNIIYRNLGNAYTHYSIPNVLICILTIQTYISIEKRHFAFITLNYLFKFSITYLDFCSVHISLSILISLFR